MVLDVFTIALSGEKIGMFLCPARDRILVEEAELPPPQRPVGTIFLKKSQKKSK